LRGCRRIAIAFSGGVDSSLLLKIAHGTLGDGNTLALFADSCVQSVEERQQALETATAIGARVERVNFLPLSVPGFVENGVMRCYHCKKNIFSAFLEGARQQEIPLLVDGTNLDDLGMDRPGMRAVVELGVQSPLADAGMTKRDIRILSRALGLRTWNRPSASCLATRIQTGIPITVERLSIVERAERTLQQLGYFGCRVRITEAAFIVELVAGDMARLVNSNDFVTVRKSLCSLGAKKVFLDLFEREGILA